MSASTLQPYNPGSVFDVSEGELRWQVFTSLAAGAKGVLYFCYWTPPGSDFVRGQAIMTPAPGSVPDNANQVPGPKYPLAKAINSKLRVYGDWLLTRTSSAVVLAAGDASNTTTIDTPNCPIRMINGSAAGDSWSFLLGLYDENRTVLLVNHDPNHPAIASVALAEGVSLQEVDPIHGTTGPARDDAPFMHGFQLTLGPGDARLFFSGPP